MEPTQRQAERHGPPKRGEPKKKRAKKVENSTKTEPK